MIRRITILMCVGLCGCQTILDLLSTDTIIDASCYGTDTVTIDGRDLCQEFEQFGRVKCDVGYRIRLNGTQVCPAPLGSEPLVR